MNHALVRQLGVIFVQAILGGDLLVTQQVDH